MLFIFKLPLTTFYPFISVPEEGEAMLTRQKNYFNTMSTIYFNPIIHQNKQRILLRFDNIPAINKVVRTITNVKWSNTHKAWHIPRHKDVYNEAIKKLRPLALLQIPNNNQNTEKTGHDVITKSTTATAHVKTNISEHNSSELNKMILKLQGKAYSISTIKTYKNEFI